MSNDNLPDPSGPPEPVHPVGELLQIATAVAATGVVLLLAAAVMLPTMGATRSTKLQWEERKRQTQEAAEKAARDHEPAETRHE